MTHDEYIERSNVLRAELSRVSGILSGHAYQKEKGVLAQHESLQIKKTYTDLVNVLERIKQLDCDFWQAELEATDA